MERRFSVEAKTFNLLVKESVFRLEERRKGFVGVILVGHHCAAWLVVTVEEAVQSLVGDEFVESFCEDEKALMVCWEGNKAVRFLEVAAYTEGRQQGIIWIPEGRIGWGRR
jgi:hypothetical protein